MNNWILCLFLPLFYSVQGQEDSKTVLVTGGAGFIGFHTSLKLANEGGVKVVVLDSFNDYYDVNLKKSRTAVLKDKGVEVYKGNLCNERLVRYLFEKNNFDVVVHLAAQAGIQYSVIDPLSYVTNNIECLVNLLDVLALYPKVHLVYSSSSSVYGNNPHVPFSTEYPLVSPSNMYAAVKMAGEEMVVAYCEKYGLSVVGVRPFTVYGPWGRPDMAVYGLAQKIFHGEPIEVRQNSSTIVASRDFTFVEDVADGIVSATKYKPKECTQMFNLACGEVVSVSHIVKLLEKNLQKTAKINYVPLPNFELTMTHADISLTTKVLGYQPKTHVEEGIKHFVDWFKDYHVEKKYPPKEPDSSITNRMDGSKLDYINDKYHERMAKLRLKYEEYATQNNIEVAKFYKDKQFIEHKGLDSPGETIRTVSGKTVKELMKMCRIIDECVAFNSNGDFKVFLKPESEWQQSSSTLYVADIDICKAGFHNCFGSSTCTSEGPGQFKCGCIKGWELIDDHICIELYQEGEQTDASNDHMIADKIDGVSWKSLREGKEYAKFANKKYDGGEIAIYPSATGDFDRLKKACDETYHCMAFTMDGKLKGTVRPSLQWSDSNYDLYILDVDYCSMNPIGCRRGQHCKRFKAAEYKCAN